MKDYSELIDKICDGELSEEEQVVVDKLLEEDQDFVVQLEAQRDIIDHLYFEGKKEQMEEYHEEFLKERSGSGRLPRKTWLVAASLLLFLSAATLAFFKLILPKEKPAVISEDPVEIKKEIPENINVKIQQYQLYGNKSLVLTGEKGTKITFPAGCFVDDEGNNYLKGFTVNLMEVNDDKVIKAMVSGRNKGFTKLLYFSANAGDLSLNIDPLNPPLIKEEKDLFYGKIKSGKIKFQQAAIISDVIPIIDVTPEMEAYQRYVNGKKLLDSVQVHYRLSGEQYVPLKGSGMKLSKEFIEETRQYVHGYKSDPAFEVKTAKAKKSWYIYHKQRDLEFNMVNPENREDLFEGKELLKFGWYGVR